MNNVRIREARHADSGHWLVLRNALWPDSAADPGVDIRDYFDRGSASVHQCFLAMRDNQAIGLIELTIRRYAEGSHADRVPYVEGWIVAEEHRGQGVGRALMAQAERWAQSQGYSELASDAEVDNAGSIRAHHRLGFSETERIVCFLKKLNPDGAS